MKKRILSAALALLFVASLPVTAFADYNLDYGNVTVTATVTGSGEAATTTQSVTYYTNYADQGGTQETDTGVSNPVITQNDSSKPTTNTVTITANQGATANVTLSGVNINTSDAAVSISGAGNVTIELNGTNKVTSGDYHAGVEKKNDGSLTITDADNNGSLTATGGDYSAGIGGGNQGSGSNITITGGEVTANGGINGAGIGGGDNGDGSNITITGGKVNATGGENGAGIGGGYSNNNDSGNGSNITITGGTVKANGGKWGAGIGGGVFGNGSDITISGGTVNANGGDFAAGIGGGDQGSGSDITISGGEVTAKGSIVGAGIGGGAVRRGSNITVSGDAQVKVQGGNEYKKNGFNIGAGAPIGNGGGYNGSVGAEVEPDVSKLTTRGKIEYYAPGVNMSMAKPTKTTIGTYVPPVAAKAAEQTVKLYSVVDKDGKDISYKSEVKDGVLIVTVDADYAALTGAVSGISVLTAQGIKTVVFVTGGATSTFDLADLSAKDSGTYKLTHDGAAVTFALGTTDISEILK